MKEAKTEKLLGDWIDCGGNSQSIVTTINKRYGLTVSVILDIKRVVEDCRADSVGGFLVGLKNFELCVVPYLLLNSETWDNIPKEALKTLNKLHYMFLRYLLATPSSTCIPLLLWDTASLTMEMRINQRKLSLYHHLMNLSDNSLAKAVAKQQDLKSYPGLISECRTLLIHLGLTNSPQNYTKLAWKRLVKSSILLKKKRN